LVKTEKRNQTHTEGGAPIKLPLKVTIPTGQEKKKKNSSNVGKGSKEVGQ